ncbi:MAG: hypothetical protein ABIN96_04125 [Rubrivivax sp.]
MRQAVEQEFAARSSEAEPTAVAVVVAVLLGIAWGPAGAQPAVAAAASSASSAEMQRAERLANNPMRAILEAGKVRRRPATEASAPSGSAAPSAAARAPSTINPAGASAQARPTFPPTVVETPPPLTPPLSRLGAIGTIGMPATAAVDPLTAAPAAAGTAIPNAPLATAAAALRAPEPAQPRLLATVDPGMPTRIQDELGSLSSVWVDLDLRADGSVAAVQVLPPAPRSLARLLVPVLLQWRYEPLPEAQRHRLELVFTPR